LQQRDLHLRRRFTLSGGDDYELCFTAPVRKRDAVYKAAQAAGTPVTRIGSIDAAAGLRLLDAAGEPLQDTPDSFDHFRS
ncbi:thiamine-phosphate kinase, partial [Herbaspirillum frisingense]